MTAKPSRGLWQFVKDEGGGALVEFALVFTLVFVPTVFGIIEFGRLIWAKNMVTAAAREGVRFAVVRGSESGSTFDSAAVATYVEGRTKLPGITVATAWTGSKDPQDTVTVTVQYRYTPIVSIRGLGAKTVTGVSKQIIWQ
jgi:Flp pilus assembly protein TadG